MSEGEKMTSKMKWCLVVAGVAVLLVVWLVASYNGLVRQEEGIVASYEDMKNIHASIYNNIKSQGLVAERYGEMVVKAIEASISGRYGKSGSQAAVQMITEQNPNIDPGILKKLQVVIEASYNKFETAQRDKIDRVRIYRSDLRGFPTVIIATLLGFPKIDMRLYSETIITENTAKTFETKKMDTIDPFAR